MDHQLCPGSRTLRQPRPEVSACPSCGGEIEIWSDEIKGRCLSCGRTLFRDNAMGCLDWCKHAQECVGTEIYGTYRRNRGLGVRHRLMERVQEYFGDDPPRIEHVQAVLAEAERIVVAERADPHLVIPACIVHEVGAKDAEDRAEEADDPGVARRMLLAAGLSVEETDEICEIVAHRRRPGIADTASFRVFFDADHLAGLADVARTQDPDKAGREAERTLLTPSGRARVGELLSAPLRH